MNKSWITFIFILGLFQTYGQDNTSDFKVDLNQKCWLKSHAYSEELTISDSLEYSFLGISAYTTDTLNIISLEYRIKEGGEWSSWQHMPTPHGGKPTQRQSFVAEPVFQPITALQIRSSDTLDEPLVLRLFAAPREKKSLNQNNIIASGPGQNCNCPKPAICERSCWCPTGDCPPPTSYTTTVPSHIIVHHSAGFTNYHDYAWVVSYYWDLHVNTNGWDDIGYNWLIDPNGVIYEGRGQGNSGAHFSCMNSNTTGICIIGNYMNNPVSNLTLTALVNLVAWESCTFNIDPADTSLHQASQLTLAHISGHRDGNSATIGCPKGTVCPGDNLYPKLDSLAAEISVRPCLISLSEQEEPGFEIFPNPAHEMVKLRWNTNQWRQVKLISLTGATLQSWEGTGLSRTLNLNSLAPGSYLILIENTEFRYSRKILIQ